MYPQDTAQTPSSSTKSPGDTWLIEQKGELWPCIIWPKENLHETFRQIKHRESDFAVFILGRHMFRWCSAFELKEFVPSDAEINNLNNNEDKEDRHCNTTARKYAFEEALRSFPLSHYENIVRRKVEDRKNVKASTIPNLSRIMDKNGTGSHKHVLPETVSFGDGHKVNTAAGCVKQETNTYSFDGRASGASFRYGSASEGQFVNLCSDDDGEPNPQVVGEEQSYKPQVHNQDHFRQQLLARNNNRPVVKHSMASNDKTLEVLKDKPDTKVELGLRSSEDGNEDEHARKLNSRKPTKRKHTSLQAGIMNIGREQNSTSSMQKKAPKKPRFGRVGVRESVISDGEDDDDEPVLPSSSSLAHGRSQPAKAPLKGNTFGGRKAMAKNKGIKQAVNFEDVAARLQKVRFYMDKEASTKDGNNEPFYIGNMAMVQKYPHFKTNLIIENDQPCVRSEALSWMNQEEFNPIAEFLESGDYSPRLLEGPYPQLSSVKSQQQYEDTAVAAGGIWNRGKDMQMTDLMRLVCKKIQAQWPLDSSVLLFFTKVIYFSPDSGLEVEAQFKKTILDEITRRFFELMMEESRVLSRLMMDHEEIAVAIGKALHEDPTGAGRANLEELDDWLVVKG